MRSMPLVSVIMGIYNCEKTLKESIESIINQTYSNWQLIMCDDNSKDDTYDIALEYEKKFKEKIILIKNERNIGLAGSLNNCLKYVSGDYIARQDGDDISVENRFEKQVEFLLYNEEYDLVGTSMTSFNDKGIIGIRGVLREKPDINKLAVIPPFCHATIMVKVNVYKELNGYRVTKYTKRCEDIDLWFRFFNKGYKGINIKDPLYMVRDDEDSYKRRNFKSYLYATKVCFDGYRLLRLPIKSYVYLSKPMIAALTPTFLKKVYQRNRKL
ncbi:MAG: glycosyltransferase family 2 protein [Clostridium sp.]|uniref:glycosyltransferase family 2 protein n=1 Tax=Clostridium sp. TaxID=1506 RepID=UPI003F3C658F